VSQTVSETGSQTVSETGSETVCDTVCGTGDRDERLKAHLCAHFQRNGARRRARGHPTLM